ncbi:M14 family metallopeptidase [Cetobacterium sp. 8H]|uniref:M14 family metallopeptidase n=1 Tax=Cetobacterium sp. 8H TaxID=2759681 RepID=UPI00351B11F4
MLKLGNLICQRGEKINGFLDIEGYEIPVTIINGKSYGKTIGISAGIHCCEYTGIQTAIELAKELTPDNIIGTLIILHGSNYSGFFKRVPGVIPEDNKNLNRVFPGNKNGSLTEKIAYYFSNELYPKLDFFIDLHGGDTYENVMDFIYAPGIGDEKVIEFSHLTASALDLEYRVKSKSSTGAYNSAAIQGVPGFLIEIGGMGIWSKEDVEKYKRNVRLALEFLELLEAKESLKRKVNQKMIVNAKYIDSPLNGFWYPKFNPGDKFKKDDIIGEIKNVFGEILKVYKAEFNGIILYETVSLAIEVGNPLIAYGEIQNS